MSSTPALSTHNVTYKIGNKPILKRVSLDLVSGQFHGILGPNGAGKTTLLKIITGQLTGEGRVSWQNRNIADYAPQALARQIAVVNQINDSVFSLTASQVVTIGLLPHKTLLSRYSWADRAQVARALKDVGLADKSQQHFSALSGGEQQRCLIARALVQGAPLLVLDEPVNHLDVYYQHQTLHLLHSLCQQQGKTVIVSLHDLNLAAAYCDNLVLLAGGEAMAAGSPSTVLNESLLTTTFNMPCTVHTNVNARSPRVEFIPPYPEFHSVTDKGEQDEG